MLAWNCETTALKQQTHISFKQEEATRNNVTTEAEGLLRPAVELLGVVCINNALLQLISHSNFKA